MLIIARTLAELDFSKLMEIYVEGNREHGQECWPEKSAEEQLRLSEIDFYAFLEDRFFVKPGAVYMIWSENNRYLSALRLEPFRDGLLLEALETLPQERRKGYASDLITVVLDWLKHTDAARVYSHVNKQNVASLRTHARCGFEIFLNYSLYNDGTRNDNAFTMRYLVKK